MRNGKCSLAGQCWATFAAVLIVGVFIIAMSPQAARAVSFVISYDSGQSDAPSYDSNGDGLLSMIQTAASMHSNIFEDTETITVNCWWEDLSGSTKGGHELVAQDGSGREIEMNVRLDSRLEDGTWREWFIDPTPFANEEFNMSQTLYRDLIPPNPSTYFSGSVPDLLETAYVGSAITGTDADGKYDALTVALHEVGHGMGMGWNDIMKAETETDNDYDVDPNFVDGNSMAVLAITQNHLQDVDALMYTGVGGSGRRKLPSATDVFAMAAGGDYSNIDLPRQDFWGGVNWNNAGNWEGNQVPGSADDAYVRDGASVTLSADSSVNNLLVDEDAIIFTDENRLRVYGKATVGDGALSAYISIMHADGELDADELLIGGNGTVTVSEGGTVDTDILDIKYGGALVGSGTVDVSSSLSNSGEIRAGFGNGGHLIITTSSGGNIFDLDGSENGEIEVTMGNLTVDGLLSDAFSSSIFVSPGRTATFTQGWELDGTLNMEGSGGTPASIEGGLAVISGDLLIDGNNCRFGADAQFTSSASVSLPDADDILYLYGQTYYDGASFTGNGKIVQNGNATVSDDTTIDVNIFDWDGGSNNSSTVIAAHLTINSSQLDASDNDYGGSVTLWNDDLTVNTASAWQLDGTMTMRNGSVFGQDMQVYGSLLAAQLMSSGTSNAIFSDAVFESGSSVSVETDCTLNLYGQTTYDGTTVSGDGRLRQNAGAVITADSTISVGTFDMDGQSESSTITIDPNVTLTINSTQIDVDPPTLDGFDGTILLSTGATLDVNTTEPWRMEGTLEIDGASGYPTIDGTEMVVAGNLTVSGGIAYCNAPVRFESMAVVSVGTGAELDLKGITTFQGGSYTGDGRIQQNSDAAVEEATTIGVGWYDMDGTMGATELTLDDHLTLDVDYLGFGVNQFDGTININNPGRLTVNTPTAWTMAGTMNLDQNGQPSQSMVDGADMNVTGTINVVGQTEIAARIDLSGTISLPGMGDLLRLGSGMKNTMAGGQISGAGEIASSGGNLAGYGNIGAVVNFNSGGDLLAEGGTLQVSGTLTTVDVIGTNGATAVLDVTNSWSTSVATRLQLAGGTVTGGGINNDGTLIGYGTITSAALINNGLVAADGGELVLDPSGVLDLDGNSPNGIGQVRAINGNIHILKDFPAVVDFHGTLYIGAGHKFHMDLDGMKIARGVIDGTMVMQGGQYIAPKFFQASELNVETDGSTISSQSVFLSQSKNNLTANLRLEQSATVVAGAQFNGNGDLLIAPGCSLNIEDGATIGVDVVNEGDISPGTSPGHATIDGDLTMIGGSLEIEVDLAMLEAGSDHLSVSGQAVLDGDLVLVELVSAPLNLGDSLEIMDFVSRSGVFSTTTILPVGSNASLACIYGANDITLRVTLQGDVNLDDKVDDIDATILATNWQVGPGATWCHGDFNGDGFVNNMDSAILASNWLQGFVAASSVPEPTGLAALLGLTLVGLGLYRGKRY